MNISLAAEPLFIFGNFVVTNTLLMSWLIVIFLVVIALVLKSRLTVVPRGLQNVTEMIFEGAINFMASVTQSREKALRFFPLVMTIFIFVILSNWLEIVPGLGSVGIYEIHEGRPVLVPFIRSASADLNFTLAIAISSVLGTQIFGIAALGFFKYAKKFINFSNPLLFFVGLLELISEIAKMVSFSFRLFGNIFAGEVLLLVVGFLVPYLVPLPFLFLEIFVGFIQALVFAMLTLVFLLMAVSEHEAH